MAVVVWTLLTEVGVCVCVCVCVRVVMDTGQLCAVLTVRSE